ncbi:Histone H2A deubiquitinase MYSM1 [Smittium mucronatum]|uniref:Histone H2A deubiquitinase MYSM1 n=1 Tax=Smittium mucronatum TaxID=133383 RepID=A0A1R0GN84_9FUNG|nr:Histone H2A deubiquitinase MYSM1 [Smittium mucronatum]
MYATIIVLTVKQSFPCKAISTDDDHLNVEMDPTSEFLVRQEIANLDMRVVGWYHSHPSFLPDPSNIDIENQNAYQKLFMDNGLFELDELNSNVNGFDSNYQTSEAVVNVDALQEADSEATPSSKVEEKLNNSSKSAEDMESIGLDSQGGGGLMVMECDKSNLPEFNETQIPKMQPSKGFESKCGPSLEPENDQDVGKKGAPFIGAIVGPYDPKLPKSFSVINWFMVICEKLNSVNKLVPKKLIVNTIADDTIPESLIYESQKLIDSYSNNTHRTKFLRAWRAGSDELRLTKCLLSLAVRIPWVSHQVGGSNDDNKDRKDDKTDSLINSSIDVQEPTAHPGETSVIVSENMNELDDSSVESKVDIEHEMDMIEEEGSKGKNSEGNLEQIDMDRGSSEMVNILDDCENDKYEDNEFEGANKSLSVIENSDDDSSDLSSVDIGEFTNNVENTVLGESCDSTDRMDILEEHGNSSSKHSELPVWIKSIPFLSRVHGSLMKWV